MADPSPGGTQNTEQGRTWWETSLSDVSALTAASRRCECGQETTKMHQFALDQHLTSDNHRRKMKQPSFKRAPGYEPHKDTTKQQKLCFKRARSTPSPSCASCVCTHRQPSPCAACTHPELPPCAACTHPELPPSAACTHPELPPCVVCTHPELPPCVSPHPAVPVRILNSHPALRVRTLNSHPALPARTLSPHPALSVRTLNSHPAVLVRTLSWPAGGLSTAQLDSLALFLVTAATRAIFS